jgi:Holliday junction resolvase
MSRTERTKGKGGELEVARIFQAHGFDCDRTPNSGGLRIRGDLHGDLPVHVEVKRQETARPWAWAKQAREESPAGATWLVAMRRSHDEWLAMLPLARVVRLLAIEAAISDEIDDGTLLGQKLEKLIDEALRP